MQEEVLFEKGTTLVRGLRLEPSDRPHRAHNIGGTYEELTIVFRDREGAPHQPKR
ncbi:MAG TPA: hypothetical protein VEL12_10850 [Candidatus Nitrosopolaris sp.]|nr:hypothetical protein [Candidatus Nitrosopolaris sp.]